jgi:hypothetical protein
MPLVLVRWCAIVATSFPSGPNQTLRQEKWR